MRERPILFSAPMVRALLDGSKTQTRRPVKPQPRLITSNDGAPIWRLDLRDGFINSRDETTWPETMTRHSVDQNGNVYPAVSPYGASGDHLWVREEHYRFGHWEPVPSGRTKHGRQKWRFVEDTKEVRFDAPVEFRKGRHHKDASTPAWHKRLARFMPRRMSRLTLEVTGVRVERLHSISEADALAEGFAPGVEELLGGALATLSSQDYFKNAWCELYGYASWEANPWVWVIGFRWVEVSHG